MSTSTVAEPLTPEQVDPNTDMVTIVPTRGRPDNAVELIKAFNTTGTVSRVVFALDDDDPTLEMYLAVLDRRPKVSIALSESPSTMVKALNATAMTLARADDAPFAIAFMGDDHRPRTTGWDRRYVQALHELGGTGLVYGNDLHQRGHLPTEVAISTNIIRTLGFMSPPTLRHLYVDNFWLRLGQEIHRLTYLDDVIVEHVHPGPGKAEWDDGYRRVNAPEMWAHDKQAYRRYIATQFRSDVVKLKQLIPERPMIRKRLRPMLTRRQLGKLYAVPHNHEKWFDHRLRVDVTVAIAAQFYAEQAGAGVIADLSCGDAEIPRRIAKLCGASKIYLGDYAPGYDLVGPIEKTIDSIEPGSVDLWVCSETIEHLEDPDSVLAEIRKRTKLMILSTPDGEKKATIILNTFGHGILKPYGIC